MLYQVKPCSYGHGLFATAFISAGQVIDHFTGYETAYQSLSDALKRLVIYLGHNRAFVITNDLVYANHSCDPNCQIADRTLVALRAIPPDEQLTFSYNVIPAESFNPADDWWWDELWSFTCGCGSPACQGRIDGYRFV